MTFEEILDQAVAMLQRRGRLTYRTLRRQFGLDDEVLEDLKDELPSEQGLPLYAAHSAILRGWSLTLQKHGTAGMEQSHQGLRAYQTIGAKLTRPWYGAMLAEASAQVGQVDEGIRVLDEALSDVDATGEHLLEAELHRLKGELLLTLPGEHDVAAEHCLDQALSITRHQHAKSLELRAATSLARLWKSQGKQAEARELLESVYSWFTEGFDTADLMTLKPCSMNYRRDDDGLL